MLKSKTRQVSNKVQHKFIYNSLNSFVTCKKRNTHESSIYAAFFFNYAQCVLYSYVQKCRSTQSALSTSNPENYHHVLFINIRSMIIKRL